MIRQTLLALAAVATITGCSSMKPEDFADTEPRLVLEDYFTGQTRAFGLFEDRFGDVRRQFVVHVDGTFDGETLTLDERFAYADGETERRVWRIRRTGPDTYEGRADDIVGVAEGRIAGNALNWRYHMDLKVGDGTWRVGFDDWMFLQPGGVLINRATVTKWGLEIGTVTIAFSKAESHVDQPLPGWAGDAAAQISAPPPAAE